MLLAMLLTGYNEHLHSLKISVVCYISYHLPPFLFIKHEKRWRSKSFSSHSSHPLAPTARDKNARKVFSTHLSFFHLALQKSWTAVATATTTTMTESERKLNLTCTEGSGRRRAFCRIGKMIKNSLKAITNDKVKKNMAACCDKS